jgi:hypothetical protein
MPHPPCVVWQSISAERLVAKKARVPGTRAFYLKSAAPVDINRGLTDSMFIGVIHGCVFKL